MPNTRKAWLQIHLCVLLWGFTAILGKLISLASLPLVLWRMGMVAAGLLLVPAIWRGIRALNKRQVAIFGGIGCLVALHWLTFYGAIKLANASVAVTCIATVPVFLAIVEPVLAGRRFQIQELALGLLAIPGILLVVGGTPANMHTGILMGLVSAALVAFFAALNKRYVLRSDPLTVTAIEMAAGAILLLLFALTVQMTGTHFSGIVDNPALLFVLPAGSDLFWLIVLAFACTLLPFALSLAALRHLSAYASSLVVNLEPVYAIILAALLLSEQQELTVRFYLGALIIMAVVLVYPLLTRRQRRLPDYSPPAS